MRWVLLCLLRLERDDDALQWAEEAMAAHPLYTDLHYLAAGLMRRRGREKRARELAERCRLVVDAAFYPEYFSAVAALASAEEETARAAGGLRILFVSWEPVCQARNTGTSFTKDSFFRGLPPMTRSGSG